MDGCGYPSLLERGVWFTGILLLLVTGVPDVKGQDRNPGEVRRTAITLGLGTTSTPEYDASGTFLLHGGYTRGPHRFAGRIASAFDVIAEEGQTDLGVLYGPALSWSWGQVSAGTGIAFTWGSRTNPSDPRTVPGLPLEVTLYVTPPIGYGAVGVTASAFANVNQRQSFAGVTFGLVFGDLR